MPKKKKEEALLIEEASPAKSSVKKSSKAASPRKTTRTKTATGAASSAKQKEQSIPLDEAETSKKSVRKKKQPVSDEVTVEPVSVTEKKPARKTKKTVQPESPEPIKPAKKAAPKKTAAAKTTTKTPAKTKAPRQKKQVTPPVVAEPIEPVTEQIPAPMQDLPIQDPPVPATESASQESQALLLAQLEKMGRPVHIRDLEKTLTRQALNRLGGWQAIGKLLEELVSTGQLVRTQRKMYGLAEHMNLVRGRFQASAAGFGFVIPDGRSSDDYYIPEGKTREAWNGDIVLVRPQKRNDFQGGKQKRGQRAESNTRAVVVQFVQRAYQQLVGTLIFERGYPVLQPDDPRARHNIMLFPDQLDELEEGARVVVQLFWPEQTGEDEVFGQVIRVLGIEDDPETETEAVMIKYNLRGEFPEEVIAQAQAIPREIPPEALLHRLDLRDKNIFTVDGADAKDFDDAIHIETTPEGFLLGIHIADVSHYVQEGSALDTEAYSRATSVYLPGRVLPMLPEHLSNGVCSLVPHEDRLTLSALVTVSAEGEIIETKLTPSVIHSKARLTYDQVQAYSEGKATLPEGARHLEGDLHLLLRVTSKLRQQRTRNGSLDFKLKELKIDVKDGQMSLIPIQEDTARGLIEDMMLLANKVVAMYLIERDIPTLFRVHEEPTLQRFSEVSVALARMGLAFQGKEATPQTYQAILKKVRGTPKENVVNSLLLRSMQQARYAHENLGHFGLAFDQYLHFTSPIRRYPDLVVHRTLKYALTGDYKTGNQKVAEFARTLPELGAHTSDRERIATEAERDLAKYYQCKWAQAHQDEPFAATVSGVVSSGLYVTLENGVEGKIQMSSLNDDYYVYIEEAQILKGRSKGRVFRLGDALDIRIDDVKPLARQISCVLNQEGWENMTEAKVRARRREEREAEHREKLKSVPVSPKKFTLDEPTTERSSTESSTPRSMRPQRPPVRESRSRRVVTLERPRSEHLRPISVTVQRMYFGDWTIDQLQEEREPERRGYRPRDNRTDTKGSWRTSPRAPRSPETEEDAYRRRRRPRRLGAEE